MTKSPDQFLNGGAFSLLQACAIERDWDDSIKDEARMWSIASANADGLEVAQERHALEAIEIVANAPAGMLKKYGNAYRPRYEKMVSRLVELRGLSDDARYA